MTRWSLVLAVLVLGCGVKSKVQRLDLHDPRLPTDAQLWLVDAEDEVEISRAMVEDTATELAEEQRYRRQISKQIARADDAIADSMREAFDAYMLQRVSFRRQELTLNQARLALAQTRLVQVRAETAMRHDIAIYRLKRLHREIDELRKSVATAERALEDERAEVEAEAISAWQAYRVYAIESDDIHLLWTPL